VTRIEVDVNDEWLAAARAELGIDGDEATINAALSEVAHRYRAKQLVETLNAVEMDLSGSASAWRYGGGRDLSRLAELARERPAAD
jgi:Arc/MetJ family transcription regulator